jgi:hypothetical protein
VRLRLCRAAFYLDHATILPHVNARGLCTFAEIKIPRRDKLSPMLSHETKKTVDTIPKRPYGLEVPTRRRLTGVPPVLASRTMKSVRRLGLWSAEHNVSHGENMITLMSEIARLLAMPGMDPDRAQKLQSLTAELLVLSEQNGG